MPARRSRKSESPVPPRYDDPANIPGYERLYLHTRNPIYAWEAWRVARANRLPIPEWVAK